MDKLGGGASLSGEATAKILLVDANALIDLSQDHGAMLRLVARYAGEVYVPDVVLGEVSQLSRTEIEALGVCVVESPLGLQEQAAIATDDSPLAFADWVCLLTAKENSWVCVTNDKRLRRECEAHGVSLRWGLQVLLKVVEHGGLSADAAVAFADALRASNPWFGHGVLADFASKARVLEKRRS